MYIKATALSAYTYSVLVLCELTATGSCRLQYASKYHFSMDAYTTSENAL